MSDTGQPADLAERFRPVFAKIAEGALERENTRRLPHAEAAGHATTELFDRADAAVYSAQGRSSRSSSVWSPGSSR